MNIEKEIINQLTTQGKVVLTGFGTFVTNDKAAEINPDNNTFNPPSKTVIFIYNEAETDNSFVNHLSVVYNKPYEETFNIVNVLIADIKSNLERFNKHIFEGFGLLSLSSTGEYFFELNSNVSLSAESVGMESFTSPDIKREKPEPTPKAPKKKRSKFWIILLIVLLVLIGTTVGAYFLFPEQANKCIYYAENKFEIIKNKFSKKEDSKTKDEKSKAITENKLKINDKKIAKPPTQKVSKESVDTIKHTKKDITDQNTKSNPAVKEKPIDVNKKMYYLVAGSFKSKENAEKFVNDLKAKLYPNAMMLDNPKKGFYTVAYDRFADKETANLELKKINSKEKSGSWIILE